MYLQRGTELTLVLKLQKMVKLGGRRGFTLLDQEQIRCKSKEAAFIVTMLNVRAAKAMSAAETGSGAAAAAGGGLSQTPPALQ